MRVLVTGATGFLGMRLCSYLAERGFDVVATGRSARPSVGAEAYQVDLSRPFVLPPVEAIVHCAALSAPAGRAEAFERANIEATKLLLDYARREGVARFVNISSPSVYFAFQDQLAVAEDMALPKPINHYARTKAEAERMVLATPEVGPVSLRPRGIYGPGDTALLPRLLDAARRHPLPLFRSGRGKIDLTYVDDVCAAIACALGTQVQGVFNISGGEVMPVREIVDRVCAKAGVPPRWMPAPLWPLLAVARAAEWVVPEPRLTRYGLALLAYEQSLNISKAQRELGWVPKVAFAEGLERTFAC